MKLLDWLRDGLLTNRARYRRAPRPRRLQEAELHELLDPSGRHDFGRRAHRPDPKARYGFDVRPPGPEAT